jgi:hypothetical protein
MSKILLSKILIYEKKNPSIKINLQILLINLNSWKEKKFHTNLVWLATPCNITIIFFI